MGHLFVGLGLLSKTAVVIKSASQMQTGYVGQAGIQTREILREARGGVLLIDEAYALMQDQFTRQACRAAALMGPTAHRIAPLLCPPRLRTDSNSFEQALRSSLAFVARFAYSAA